MTIDIVIDRAAALFFFLSELLINALNGGYHFVVNGA